MLNGFLPCGLVYAFLALAVNTDRMMGGMLMMIGFGFGTMPAMIGIGCGARLLSHAARHAVIRIAACFVIVLGVTTIARGLPSSTHDCCATHEQPAQDGVADISIGHE